MSFQSVWFYYHYPSFYNFCFFFNKIHWISRNFCQIFLISLHPLEYTNGNFIFHCPLYLFLDTLCNTYSLSIFLFLFSQPSKILSPFMIYLLVLYFVFKLTSEVRSSICFKLSLNFFEIKFDTLRFFTSILGIVSSRNIKADLLYYHEEILLDDF